MLLDLPSVLQIDIPPPHIFFNMAQGDQASQGTERDTHSTHTFDVPYRPKAGTSFTPREAPKEKPKITPIPRINMPGTNSPPHTSRPSSFREKPESPKPEARPASSDQSPASLAQGLEGKYVDEFGNILDWNGTVLGRVEGDLPSMVGRPVSESGQIHDADGEAVGYVSENHAKPPLKELDGGLRVDDDGNIFNADGTAIGKLNEAPKKEETEEAPKKEECSCNSSSSAPKGPAAPNPSEIYLDVKSTFDGIQIILKIPTIFNQEHSNPRRDSEGRVVDTEESRSGEEEESD